MRASAIVAGSVAVLALATIVGATWARAEQPAAPTRTALQKHDLQAHGHEGIMAMVQMPVGSREGRHTHPGDAFVYVLEGTLKLDMDGKPSTSYGPGQTFFIPAGTIHEGMNGGSVPVKAVAVFVLEKGKPLATPAK